ncbi:Gfo/Idh/MocA family protein [Candidatus Thioglobus autotrophicus]|uniref:Gfo/Idh/MocA family protein n=1 Tax=Candidatus Thioglobus autotrophicus TaxID=1705394 RepID=UPI00299EDE50|nr:Gfo/Idh/MocA family oxidoreductase [Candidatus Thioglobus autotrophicus]WPE17752.1 Gfo/Idh/MocA family oxidoreductase [Candidatus Thioglobus autotrophicus]
MEELRAGIAGFGIVGKKRQECIDKNPHIKLIAVCDEKLSGSGVINGQVKYHDNYKDLLKEDIDVLFVCMPNYMAPDVTIAGLEKSMHVFCEKPPGRNIGDIARVIGVEKQTTGKLMYGFNHRYHDSVQKAGEIISSGKFGKIINMRGVYGKSKLVTFNQTQWRTQHDLAGGGVLLDQGIHMVDLMRLFAGDFSQVYSFISNSYWGYDVEDNAYALMKTNSGIVAMLNSSATQWRHQFKLDITLEKGAIILSGILSGSKSYGDEILTVISADTINDNGNPKEKIYKYNQDYSWDREVEYFINSIVNESCIEQGSSQDAYDTMQLVSKIYSADMEWSEHNSSYYE